MVSGIRWKVGAVALGLSCAGVLAAVGCGGDASGVEKAKLPVGVRSQVIEHEACDEGGAQVEVIDTNNDGKPDIKRIYANSRELCRISDLNHDGKPDMFEYYDAGGQLRRREADYDDNGIVNSIESYENGRLARRELDTTNQGRIDTWDFFDPVTGVRTRRERDTNGDGRVDQWWTFDGDKVTIAMDRNRDGQPDPDAVITLGGGGSGSASGGSGASDAGAAASGDAGRGARPPEVAMPSPNLDAPSPTKPVTDAGVVGKPQRGGAKR